MDYLKNDTRKATIRDVAKLAGVSIKTVSRVVNKLPHVREDTRTRVQSAINKLDYTPNAVARRLGSMRKQKVVDEPSPQMHEADRQAANWQASGADWW